MLIIVLFAAILNESTTGAPISINSSEEFEPLNSFTILGREVSGCVNPARYRTMQEIIWSCLATIFACTWIAIHPNVPELCTPVWTNLKGRLMFMIYALIGPEFVTIWALRQRMGAIRHAREYNKKFRLTPPPTFSIRDWFYSPSQSRTTDQVAWTITHGFLLEMQGLVFVRDGEPFNPTPPVRLSKGQKNLITARSGAIVEITQLSKRFDITEDEINDKSKGDAFTKLIAVLQTTWFITQCIARWSTGLYVSELEVITLAFASLNALTYFLWWNKPQNMYVPIPVHIDTPPKCESCIMLGERGEAGERITKRVEDSELNPIHQHDNPGDDEGIALGDGVPFLTESTITDKDNKIPSEEPQLWPRFWEIVSNGIRSPTDGVSLLFIRLRHIRPNLEGATTILSAFLLPFWILWHFLQPLMFMLGARFGDEPTFYSSHWGLTHIEEESPQASYSMAFIGMLFGGIHLIPVWMTDFSSNLEKYLWVNSAGCIAIGPLLILIFEVTYCAFERASSTAGKWIKTFIGYPTGILMCIGFILYPAARVILLFLALTSLRTLPSEAYENVEWSTFFPHI